MVYSHGHRKAVEMKPGDTMGDVKWFLVLVLTLGVKVGLFVAFQGWLWSTLMLTPVFFRHDSHSDPHQYECYVDRKFQ
jgi:hypothetical protein